MPVYLFFFLSTRRLVYKTTTRILHSRLNFFFLQLTLASFLIFHILELRSCPAVIFHYNYPHTIIVLCISSESLSARPSIFVLPHRIHEYTYFFNNSWCFLICFPLVAENNLKLWIHFSFCGSVLHHSRSKYN